MKKLIGIIFVLTGFLLFCSVSFAQENAITLNNEQNTEIAKIKAFVDNYTALSNKRQLEKIRKLYAAGYISGDGFKLDEILNLAKESWQAYPDMTYSSEIKNIRVMNNYATVETSDKAVSNKAAKSELTNDLGRLESYSDNIIYLQKFGESWKIVTDKINFEKTLIKYGVAKNLNITLEAPEQVPSGEKYTATLYTDLPENTFSVASITKEPVSIPRVTPEEIFRQISKNGNILERMLEANSSNYNEIICASIEYAELSIDAAAISNIKPTGIALILQRVNVIPLKTPLSSAKSVDNSEDTEPLDNAEN